MKLLFFFVVFPAVFSLNKETFSVELDEEISPSFNVAADTRFLIFTQQNPLVPQVVQYNDMSSVAASNFSPNRPTRVIVHGWQSNANTPVNTLTTAAYLQSFDVNVIVVDWSVGAASINYITSRNHVPNVGALIAEFFDNIHAAGLLPDFSRVYCIGQSLGAHVCGFFGKRVARGRINSIFGLDPAGPLFDANNPAVRLDKSDADYVEIIHTDTVALGIGDPIGHSDWYPNGGTGMPGCGNAACDHAIAANYFAYSVNSNSMFGRRCENLEQMNADQCTGVGFSMGGEPSNYRRGVEGIFRMPTNAAIPFGQGPF